jgi:hypothetical protein
LKLTPAAVLALLVGLAAPVKLSLVGEIYLAELVLPLAALQALGAARARQMLASPAFRQILLAGLLTLAGYVLSDLARDTRPDQYLRGWGRVLLVLTDFASLGLLAGRDPRALWWFVLGIGLGRIAELRLLEGLPLSMWKFGYAEPMVLVAAALGALLPRQAAALWFALLAYLSAKYDFRTFALLAMVLAAFAWTRGPGAAGASPRLGRMLPMALFAGIAAAAAFALLEVMGGDYWEGRRAVSNAGRSAGLEIGWIAIGRSPFLGYGSWPEDAELATILRKLTYDSLGATWLDPKAGDDHFNPHSQILQAWVEGGAPGAALFLVLIYQTLKRLPYAAFGRPRDELSLVILYYLGTGLLNLFISPFSAPHRIGIAVGAVCLVLLAREVRGSPAHPVLRKRYSY